MNDSKHTTRRRSMSVRRRRPMYKEQNAANK
jgi:hypothetical protein